MTKNANHTALPSSGGVPVPPSWPHGSPPAGTPTAISPPPPTLLQPDPLPATLSKEGGQGLPPELCRDSPLETTLLGGLDVNQLREKTTT